MKKWRRLFLVVLLCVGPGCVGLQRGWSSGCAQQLGADWVVVQFDMQGRPFNCWKLSGVGIVNEPHSDGIYWKDSRTGHLVHLSGWYNRVQVEGGDFAAAARLLDVEISKCGDGRYPAGAA